MVVLVLLLVVFDLGPDGVHVECERLIEQVRECGFGQRTRLAVDADLVTEDLMRRYSASWNEIPGLRAFTFMRSGLSRSRGGQPVQLTPKEFALLEYLMSHADTVVSRTRILEDVWGADADPMTNVVEVYIRHLRNKIDKGRRKSLIRNERGFGYQLDPEA